MNVFSGSSESGYPPAGNPRKEKTHTVVPPTEVGGGSHFDFAVSVGATTDKDEVIDPVDQRERESSIPFNAVANVPVPGPLI